MFKFRLFLLLLIVFSLIASCTSEKDLKGKVEKVIQENPDILLQAIEKNPVKFIETFQKAIQVAQQGEKKRRAEEEQKKMEESFNKPLKANIRKDETIRGTKGAPIVLIEYSDFECPFCSRGYETVRALLDKYKGKIQFIYKHLPLSFHQNAMIASQYYEAIRLQDAKKAFEFHDEIYKSQSKLRNGEKFLKALAKKVGANMTKLAKDFKSKKVMDRINEDLAEAKNLIFKVLRGFSLTVYL